MSLYITSNKEEIYIANEYQLSEYKKTDPNIIKIEKLDLNELKNETLKHLKELENNISDYIIKAILEDLNAQTKRLENIIKK